MLQLGFIGLRDMNLYFHCTNTYYYFLAVDAYDENDPYHPETKLFPQQTFVELKVKSYMVYLLQMYDKISKYLLNDGAVSKVLVVVSENIKTNFATAQFLKCIYCCRNVC